MKNKAKDTFGGLIACPILLIIGVCLLWWNEGNYVKTASAIKEAQSDYVTVKDAKYDSKNDNKVIVTSGSIIVGSDAIDETFQIGDRTAILERHVEMYQWDENCDSDNHCSYSKKWSDTPISSTTFKSGHENPDMPFKSETFYSDNVTLGDFNLSDKNLSYLNTDSTYKLEEKDATNNNMTLLSTNQLYKGKDSTKPEIGDLKVSFSRFGSENVTVLGVQNDKNITKFVGKSGKSVMYSMEGIRTGEEMFQKLVDNNKMMTWLLRLVGLILLISAVASIFAPIRLLTDRIPILNSIVGTLSGLFAILVGFALTVIVIAIAWLAYRPVAAIIAIAVVVALVVLFVKTKSKKNKETPKVEEPTPTA